MIIKVGLAQVDSQLGDISGNLVLHQATAEAAAAAKLDLLIFPELSLTGYRLEKKTFDVAIRTQANDTTFERLLFTSRSVDIIAGFVEVDDRGQYYNTAVYLSKGQLLHRHRKVYLPTYGQFDEGRYFTPGDRVRAFDTPLGRMGLLICEDYWHPSLAYLLWQDQADYLILVAASIEHGEKQSLTTSGKIHAICQNYALTFTNFVIHVNRAGEEKGHHYWGGSTIFGPDGNLIVGGPRNEPKLITATLDTAELTKARRDLPLLRDERPHLTYRELGRILREHE